jgi:hypothetical protein
MDLVLQVYFKKQNSIFVLEFCRILKYPQINILSVTQHIEKLFPPQSFPALSILNKEEWKCGEQ